MTTRPATIDLGMVSGDDPPERMEPWPWWPRLRRAGAGHWRRWLPAAAVAVLTLSTATAAEAPSDRWLAPHLTVPAGSPPAITDTLLFALGDDGTTVTAYQLRDGAPAWEAPLRHGGRVRVYGDTVVASTEHSWPARTTALDIHTGQRLWSHEAASTGAVAGNRLLLSVDRFTEADGRLVDLMVVDAETGRELWAPHGAQVDYAVVPANAPRHLVVLGRGGRLTSYDLATGAQLATARTTLDSPSLHALGPVVVVAQAGADRTVLRVRDPISLDRLWATTGAPEGFSWLVGCGVMACYLDVGRWEVHDPWTGKLAWSPDWARGLVTQYTTVLPLDPFGSAGHLVVARASGPHRAHGWVVDARTGRRVLDLHDWQVLYADSGQGLYGLQGGASNGVLAASRAWQPALTRHDDGSIWFGRLLPDHSAVQLLGTVAEDQAPAAPCMVDARYLVCGPEITDGETTVTVWRIHQP